MRTFLKLQFQALLSYFKHVPCGFMCLLLTKCRYSYWTWVNIISLVWNWWVSAYIM